MGVGGGGGALNQFNFNFLLSLIHILRRGEKYKSNWFENLYTKQKVNYNIYIHLTLLCMIILLRKVHNELCLLLA